MKRSSTDSRKSTAPGRVARSSTSKPSAARFSTSDRLSSVATSSAGNQRNSLMGRSSFGKFSTGGMSKRFSHGVDRGRMEVRDPRPINSRAYQQRCVKVLLEFLTTYGYPNSITEKTLMSPTTKDFLKVFEFIVKHIEFKYKVPDKYEDEIPRYLHRLRYPFPIPKSSMLTVGSPHTWPAILAALVWLVDIVKAALAMTEDGDNIIFQQDDFDGPSVNLLKFHYLEETYKAFMKGSDEFEHFDQNLHAALKQKYCGDDGALEKLERENANLSEKLREYECIAETLKELQETKEKREQDLVSITAYMAELTSFEANQKKILEEENNELVLLDAERESVRSQLKSLQVIFDNQEYTPADVERIKMEEQELQNHIDTLEKEVDEIDQEIWSEELAIGKEQEKLNENCKQHNKLGRALYLIPANAENANGLDFELKPGFWVGNTQDHFKQHKLQLLEIKNGITEELHASSAEKRRMENIVEQETDQLEEMSSRARTLLTNLKRLEEEFKCEKNLYEQSIETKQSLYDQEYEEMNEAHKSLQQCIQDVELLQVATVKAKEFSVKEIEKGEEKLETHIDFLRKVIGRVAEHKKRISDHLMSSQQEMDDNKTKARESIYTSELLDDD